MKPTQAQVDRVSKLFEAWKNVTERSDFDAAKLKDAFSQDSSHWDRRAQQQEENEKLARDLEAAVREGNVALIKRTLE